MKELLLALFLSSPFLVPALRVNRDVSLNINSEIDDVLTGLNQVISATGLEVLSLDDIHESYTARWRFIKATADFTATNGKGRSLATLQRTGDATLSASPSSLTLDLHLGLGQIQANYDYRLAFKLFRVSGSIGATVNKFSLGARVTLYVDEDEDTCQAVLDSATVEQLDDIDISVSGLGVLDWTMEKILEWVTGRLQTELQTKLQDSLSAALVKQLNKREICDLLYNI